VLALLVVAKLGPKVSAVDPLARRPRTAPHATFGGGAARRRRPLAPVPPAPAGGAA